MSVLGQFIRFAGVGGMCTGLQYLILVLLVTFLDIHPVAASTAGYILSALLNYQLNRVYTFRSGAAHLHALPRFFAIALVGLVLNAAVLGFMVSVLGLFYMLGQIVATVVTLFWNFIANRTWTFAKEKSDLEITK